MTEFGHKLSTREQLRSVVPSLQKAGKKVGYTSGVFDLLHPGHVAYLGTAKSKVDVLVVGVNSDSSVRQNKGPKRPICDEDQRAKVVAGLSSVDFVFVFSELNNNVNIEQLRPDVYLKAGDYSSGSLSSASIVESYGGRVEIVPFETGYSSTAIIEKAAESMRLPDAIELPAAPPSQRPAVFIDRDGTLIEEVEYIADPEAVREIPGAFAAVKELRARGYRLVIVTNQPGIGLGYLTRDDFLKVNKRVFTLASKQGALFDRVCFCPHSKSDDCDCRKPNTGLVLRAAKELNLDIANSFVIGDMTSDVELAHRLGCRSVLVRTGKGGSDGLYSSTPAVIAADMREAVEWILAQPGVPELKKDRQPLSAVTTDQNVMEALGRFGGDIGHDFNNILGSIKGCIDLIRQKTGAKDGGAEHPVAGILTILESAVERGIELTSKLRSFLRTGASKSKVDLRGCLQCVADLINKNAVRGKSCEVQLICPEDLFVEVAESSVTQMFLQVCKNSVDAMEHLEDKILVIHAESIAVDDKAVHLDLKPGPYVRVSVIDHGKGIKQEFQETVFTPFFSTKVRGVGKGLGLSMSMAKAVMHQHGGTLTLASKADVGTTISFLFPRVS